ncbi:MAG TPA: pyridoxal phosphate-dependent aminotransferase family protein [Cyclobacteriaceae bacterium]|nr:pyridoxal phosphate-dependent aminotransferase family protein [Cyclobacteriaceae bacterium]
MVQFRWDSLENKLLSKLSARKQENSLRKLSVFQGRIDFSSNDYLGLARSEGLFKQIQIKAESLPHRNGATGSRLLSGNSAYAEEVEKKLASIFKSESALIFNSGYAANQGVLSSIPQKGDTILYDELAHACIRDGARLSMASRFPFLHNNLSDLEERLKRAQGNIFIAVESIYSMDGDVCPLQELVTLAEKYSATIILDEAHSTGVVGKDGAGLAVSLGIETKIPIRIYTFGKAMGVHGACVAGSNNLIDYLINFSRTFIFTTALSPHSIASIDCAFEYLAINLNKQQHLNDRVRHFIEISDSLKIQKLRSNTQIQGVVIPGNERIRKVAQELQSNGFDVRPILSPTVAQGSERLRICLHTFNSLEEITQLVQQLSKF